MTIKALKGIYETLEKDLQEKLKMKEFAGKQLQQFEEENQMGWRDRDHPETEPEEIRKKYMSLVESYKQMKWEYSEAYDTLDGAA